MSEDKIQSRQNEEGENSLSVSLNQDSIDTLDSVAKGKVPTKLKKTFYCSLSLLILGLVLLMIGIEETIRLGDFMTGITFYIISFLVIFPGGYYSYKFYRAIKTTEIDKRRDILDDIPEL